MNTVVPNPPPRRKDEIAINARLLYLYVGHPILSYDEWVESLHLMVSSRGHIIRYRLLTGTDGELALNDEFAAHFARYVVSDLMGAIALILIREGCAAARKGDLDYTNRMLHAWQILALGRGFMHAESLHAFLQVDETFDQWFARLKKDYAMKYKSDYIRITYSDGAEPVEHRSDTGKGEVIFGHRFALKVAAAEPTQRGMKVGRCLEIGRAAKSGLF